MDEIHLDGKSKDIVSENISILKEIFPEVITEDKIDFDKLKSILGEDIDDSHEKYSFTWPGKTQAIKESQKRSTGTLRPYKDESKNWETTKNLYIEGDNLEVLKLLQKSYYNKIKMIYIDPTYNTGSDLIYEDDYKDNLENYLKNQPLSTNSESEGRFHSKWLNFIYPRIKLSRNLLKSDGVIYISIDEHENSNLRKICDEIFGQENFIGEIIRKTKSMTGDDGSGFNLQHENLLIYAKNKELIKLHGEEKEFKNYSNPDNDVNGVWCSADPSARSGGDGTYFPIENPFTHKIDYPPKGRYWAFSKETLKKYIERGKIKFKKEHKDSERGFIFKRYKSDMESIYNPVNSLFSIENDYLNQKGTIELKNLFKAAYFDYPKPVDYIKKLIQYTVDVNEIILDFFSGSSTTAEAIFRFNDENDFKNKFIMVQLPEKIKDNSDAYKDGFKTICDIGKKRIDIAGDKIVEESGNKDLDIGFKVFKLDSSNLEKWNPDYNNIRESLMVDNIKPDRSKEDLIYELMLKYGLDLTWPIKKEENNIYSIGYGALIVCLEDSITNENTKEITGQIIKIAKKSSISRVVFKDSSFNNKDSVKTNVKEILSNHKIDKFITI